MTNHKAFLLAPIFFDEQLIHMGLWVHQSQPSGIRPMGDAEK